MVTLLVVVVLVALVVGFAVVGFNRLRASDVGAQEALGGIDVQLTRRAELVPNLVETVVGYAAHERSLLEEVTRARTGVRTAAAGPDVASRAQADAELTQTLVRVNAVSEQYPELRSSEVFQQLQGQLAETENGLAGARTSYNGAVSRLNQLTRTVPWMFLTGVAGVSRREFYEAPGDHDQVPQVRF